MATLFLALIYAAFISLGLPDSLLGVCWPVMQPELRVPYSFAGIISTTICGGTILSSFFSGPIVRRFGTANVTRVSVAMTAAALFGFFLSPSFGWLLLASVPLGLGAGAVDSVLNHFVAAHYQAHHMNWLHCSWGIGAMSGPLIVSGLVGEGGGWRSGYLAVGVIQGCLVALLFTSGPLWRWAEKELPSAHPDSATRSAGLLSVLKLRGAWPVLLAFLLYCGAESTMGLWGASFLVRSRGLDVSTAAFWVSVFYGSLTAGRFLSGFAAMKMTNPRLIRTGLLTILSGAGLMFLPLPAACSPIGFVLVGLGCAPVYPAMLHETPRRFGADLAPTLMGVQMAVAYSGATFLPPAFGFVTSGNHLALFPVIILLYGVVMLLCTEMTNRTLVRD
jgi:fucose permease